jgi:phage antirepressor YoqD-like protein
LSQLSELKVRMADDANETRLIMIRQIADQLAVGESIIEAITARQSTGQ